MQQRLYRIKDAYQYLGMTRNTFNKLVRPRLTAIPIGKTGIAFDRVDLDCWVEHTKNAVRERPADSLRRTLWDVNEHQGSRLGVVSGISTKKFSEEGFLKTLAQARSKRRKST